MMSYLYYQWHSWIIPEWHATFLFGVNVVHALIRLNPASMTVARVVFHIQPPYLPRKRLYFNTYFGCGFTVIKQFQLVNHLPQNIKYCAVYIHELNLFWMKLSWYYDIYFWQELLKHIFSCFYNVISLH